MKKNKNAAGIIYSTDPNFSLSNEFEDSVTTLPAAEQKLLIRLETKHRAGKAVTLIEGFVGVDADRDELVKKLKNFCGTGGSSKDNEMLIQGDQREKVIQWLLKNGYLKTRKK
jgi:translation initiation factor 1